MDDTTADAIRDYARRCVADAPPLTPAQRDRIALLLRTGVQEGA